MSTTAELFTIGQLARRTGGPARTIRFWSDAGLVPPAARSGSGYRLYDADAVARLDLVRTLRELGLGLDSLPRALAVRPRRSTSLRMSVRCDTFRLSARARRASAPPRTEPRQGMPWLRGEASGMPGR